MLLAMLVIWPTWLANSLQQVGEHEQSLAQPQLTEDDQISAVAQQDGKIELVSRPMPGWNTLIFKKIVRL